MRGVFPGARQSELHPELGQRPAYCSLFWRLSWRLAVAGLHPPKRPCDVLPCLAPHPKILWLVKTLGEAAEVAAAATAAAAAAAASSCRRTNIDSLPLRQGWRIGWLPCACPAKKQHLLRGRPKRHDGSRGQCQPRSNWLKLEAATGQSRKQSGTRKPAADTATRSTSSGMAP